MYLSHDLAALLLLWFVLLAVVVAYVARIAWLLQGLRRAERMMRMQYAAARGAAARDAEAAR